jgi:glycosyltransferase involved in cell wall biosynthesis
LAAAGFTLATGGPELNFGEALPRKAGAVVQGGRVKLTHLDRAFPEQRTRFNLLYLVSSAIPRHALELVEFVKARGVKLVWNQNGVGYAAWAGKFADDVNEPLRALLHAADFIIYQSAFCRASADRFLGPASAPSAILFNPVDPDFFHPAQKPPPLDELRLLTMGTHTYAERVLVTLRCLAEVRRRGRAARLTIAGRLEWRRAEEEVRRAIADLGLGEWVTVRPAFSQAEAAELCRAHHILLHPKFMDPCPTVVIEALASGLPVVAPASGGLPELVDAACGRLLPAADDWHKPQMPDGMAMAGALLEIAADWPAFSESARCRAIAHFSVAPWIERHREIFTQLLAA